MVTQRFLISHSSLTETHKSRCHLHNCDGWFDCFAWSALMETCSAQWQSLGESPFAMRVFWRSDKILTSSVPARCTCLNHFMIHRCIDTRFLLLSSCIVVSLMSYSKWISGESSNESSVSARGAKNPDRIPSKWHVEVKELLSSLLGPI